MPKYNQWDKIGYYCRNQKGQFAILIPDYCENCDNKKKELEDVEQFNTSIISKIIFKNK